MKPGVLVFNFFPSLFHRRVVVLCPNSKLSFQQACLCPLLPAHLYTAVMTQRHRTHLRRPLGNFFVRVPNISKLSRSHRDSTLGVWVSFLFTPTSGRFNHALEECFLIQVRPCLNALPCFHLSESDRLAHCPVFT